MDLYQSEPVRNQAAQHEVRLNVMCLNHPETIPRPPVHGEIVSHETCPWCQKIGESLPQCVSQGSLEKPNQ